MKKRSVAVLAILLPIAVARAQPHELAPPAPQNPSPMADHIRRHERIPPQKPAGLEFKIVDILPKPVEVFIPQKKIKSRRFDLLLHFHGAGFIVQYAATQYKGALVAATINLGAGSGVYGNAFADSTTFAILLQTLNDSLQLKLALLPKIRKVILSGFSAGYGAIRKIISSPSNVNRVAAILLLDGIHASYIPERRVLAEGGQIDRSGVAPFIRFASAAARKNSEQKFLITHSEIFPGTFVSTTEATDFILQQLAIKREPVLKWGPLGMQQLSAARQNRFAVLGFAGNTAPDHVDHLHALSYFLNKLME
ncbi:MAG: hypothetical protein ALAOOOJD_03618 [bacterium]|nr:hypothetical protein [bacterium]